MSERLLPELFQDLEPFVSAWALATERERSGKRLSSSMEEIQAFYHALLPRMDSIIAYLNQFPLENMPADAQRLLYLSFSLAEVAPAVELFKQPSVVDGYDAARFVPVHD
jgi:pyruvate/2-oxoglutarate dehydrogenase complex dihydrolipoamide acyltransferase (E2) component